MVFSRPSSTASPTWTASACADAEEVPPPPLPSSRFTAVMPQPNARWGAHIYEHRARAAWLAAFAREEAAAAARAHDVAERHHHRGRHAVTDSPECAEPATWAREHLFEKVLTPSDVGNLNRLVVPKHHAEEHFFGKRNPLMVAGMGVLLDFSDGDEGKTWRFRYSYCASSRIYIFTKGWRRFVRGKGLQAGDTVAFYRSGFGPFRQLNIDYRKTTEKKQDGAAAAGVIAGDNSSRVVMLFGVDIARR